MFYLANKKGFTFIGLLIAVLIMAFIVYGGISVWKNRKENERNIQESVNKRLEDLQKNIEESNKEKIKLLEE